jgi:hypothetical protein
MNNVCCTIVLSRTVYNRLAQLAAGWGTSVDRYINLSLQKIMFKPASGHPFAFAAMVRMQREFYNRSKAR